MVVIALGVLAEQGFRGWVTPTLPAHKTQNRRGRYSLAQKKGLHKSEGLFVCGEWDSNPHGSRH